MSIVTEVKKEDIFKRETTVSNPWLDPKFNKIDDLGGEPGFKVDDIPERLGLVQQGFDPTSPAYYFTDLEDTPHNYGTKLQFVQTDGKGKLSWAWPFWSKAGSTVYYKSGKVAIGHAAARTVLHVLTPTASEVRIEASGASDPTLSFKTTNTAHQVNFYLDESATNDDFYIEGKTAGVNTSVHIIAVDGKVAGLSLYSGATNYGALTFSASDNLNLKNSVQDKDLIFGIKDGAVEKTITWDADVDKLKHSAGTFDFDNDNIVTTGILTLSNESLHILDTNASHDLIIKAGSDLAADRILSFVTGDTARTITLTGNPTLADWFDQAVKVAATPTFDDLTISTPVNIYALSHDSFADYVASEHLAALDEDNMVSNSNTNVATQQSIKAYVDGASFQPLDATLTALAGLNTSADKYIRVTGVDTFDLRTYANVRSDIGAAVSGANSDITSMSGITGTIATPTNLSGKTTGAWSKTIGSGGDYADWATMIDAMPDLIAHAVTVTIKAGTTLTETCDIYNKHGIKTVGVIIVQAEKYYPTAGALPTADSATATTLRDAALVAEAYGNDYFNGCWIRIIDGTGTDNGFVLITDYVGATGDVVVAAWPGTQPDNTSRYIIVGALIDSAATRGRGLQLFYNTIYIQFIGIGFTDATVFNIESRYNNNVYFLYCGIDKSDLSGILTVGGDEVRFSYCGIVENNTGNNAAYAGVTALATGRLFIEGCGISDNNQRGIYLRYGAFGYVNNNFGDLNGNWGLYCESSGQALIAGTECSGAAGNHSDPGTAGNANADQAAAY